MVDFQCPVCKSNYAVKDKCVGRRMRCPQCGRFSRVESVTTKSFLQDFDSLYLTTDIYYMKALVREPEAALC